MKEGIRFRKFEEGLAVFHTKEGNIKLSKEQVRERRDDVLQTRRKKGTCSEAEEYKFALDRWPGTELGERLRKLAPRMYKK